MLPVREPAAVALTSPDFHLFPHLDVLLRANLFENLSQTVTETSPGCTLRRRSMVVRDWPPPPPMPRGICFFQNGPVIGKLQKIRGCDISSWRPGRIFSNSSYLPMPGPAQSASLELRHAE